MNSTVLFGESVSGHGYMAAKIEDSQKENTDVQDRNELLIRNPAPDSSPPAVSSGANADGKIYR